mmetsp:Transcript_46542/g.141016  ORF Transcript_46542/g.141016 Transcript_46542/m.141016 type:complete len:120 (-) Transcript_46542:635-994(-)
MRRSFLSLFSKRVTIPRLSPTHTQARIVRFEVASNVEVSAYDSVMVLECSPDFVTEAFRDKPDDMMRMSVDTQEEGIIRDLNAHDGQWLDCGKEIGWIDDGDDVDGDWTWQAYLDSDKS